MGRGRQGSVIILTDIRREMKGISQEDTSFFRGGMRVFKTPCNKSELFHLPYMKLCPGGRFSSRSTKMHKGESLGDERGTQGRAERVLVRTQPEDAPGSVPAPRPARLSQWAVNGHCSGLGFSNANAGWGLWDCSRSDFYKAAGQNATVCNQRAIKYALLFL